MKAKLISEAKMPLSDKIELRRKLDQFYGTVNDYIAFNSMSNQVECWQHLEEEINRRIKNDSLKRVKILEVGAGKSGFGEWLVKQNLRANVIWATQDVTLSNEQWLKVQADQTFYGDINKLEVSNKFDIIFSTYVFEHVTNPKAHLECLYSLLTEVGMLFIFCPRYDVPGYLCPSTRGLQWKNKSQFLLKSMFARLNSMIFRKPVFLIQTDLAAFYGPFFLDADAVHWASLIDLKLWSRLKGSKYKILKYGKSKFGSKDWIVKRFLTCAIQIYK